MAGVMNLALPVLLQDISARIFIGVGVCGAADITGAREICRISSSLSQLGAFSCSEFISISNCFT